MRIATANGGFNLDDVSSWQDTNGVLTLTMTGGNSVVVPANVRALVLLTLNPPPRPKIPDTPILVVMETGGGETRDHPYPLRKLV